VNLTTTLSGLELPNPVLTAAGCGGSGRELAPFVDLSRLGAFVTPSVMAQPRAGRPTSRLAETPSGMLTATGLPGPGVEAFLQRDLPFLSDQGARVVVSVAGNTVAEYGDVTRRLMAEPGAAIAAVEVNVACPNAEERGVMFAGQPGPAAAVVRAVRSAVRPDVPVFAKLSPDVTDIVTIALACADAGASGFSLIGPLGAMAVDTRTLRPALSAIAGGLSGPAIRPIAVRCVFQVHAALPHLPIIGCGGIATGQDALEFLLAGASAVALGTTLFHDPMAATRVLKELEEAMSARRLGMVAEIVGLAHRPVALVPRQIRPETVPTPPAEEKTP
jgi:dihydroorotate dehydrogenase (NAD+) catalytic subunit